MASRVISIDLVGRNLASKAINQVGTDSERAAAKSAAAFDASTNRIGRGFTKLGETGAAFGVPFAGALTVVGDKLDATSGKGRSFGSTVSRLGAVEAIAGAAGIALIGTASVHAAEEFQTAQSRLEVAVKNTGSTFAAQKDGIAKTDDALRKLGFTDTETESSLAKLTGATHDVGKAEQLMALASDLARAKHISLSDATQLLVQVEGGRLRGLASLGISTKDATGKTIDATEAFRRLNAVVGGQGNAYLGTFEGKMAAVRAQADHLEVTIGSALIPKIEGLASAAVSGVTGFEHLNSATDGLLGKTLAFGAAVPVVFFAFDKLKGAAQGVGHSFERLGGVLHLTSAANTTTAESTDVLALSQSEAALAASRQELAMANLPLATDAAALAQARLAEATSALALAQSAEAQSEVAAFGQTEQLTLARREYAVATAQAAEADRALDATQKQANSNVTPKTGIGGVGVAAIAATAGLAVFSLGLSRAHAEAAKLDEGIKQTITDLAAGGDAAAKAAQGLDTFGTGVTDVARNFITLSESGKAAGVSTSDLTDQIVAAGGKGLYFSGVAGKIAKSLKEQADAEGDAAKQSGALRAAQQSYADELAKDHPNQERLVADRKAVIEASKTQASTQSQVTSATQQGTDAANKNASATKDQAAAQDALLKSLKAVNDDLLAAANSDLALERANNDVGQSALAAAQATREHGKASQEATAAQFTLRGSLLSAVSAAEADAEAIDKAKIAHGQNISAIQIENDKHAAAVAELAILKGQYPQLAALIDNYRRSLDLIPTTKTTDISVNIRGGSFSVGGGSGIVRRASGGPVPGNDHSGIPILAHPGEYVMSAKGVDKYGLHAMELLNAGKLPRFASGGPVGQRVTVPRLASPHHFGDTYITVYAKGEDDFEKKIIDILQRVTRRNGSIPRVRVSG